MLWPHPVGLTFVAPNRGKSETLECQRKDLSLAVHDFQSRIGKRSDYSGGNQDPRLEGKHPELKDHVIVPDVLLQAHSASLEMVFYDGKQFPEEYHGDIFAAEHGSWNKATPGGYEVVRVPLTKGRSSGEYEDFLTGFIIGNGDAAWGRPVGVAVASDGSLLVTDDASKSIWRVAYVGK